MAVKNQTGAQRGWPQRRFSELQGQLSVPLIIIAIYSVVCLGIHGATGNHNLFMLLGSIASMVEAFLYVLSSFLFGATSRAYIKHWLNNEQPPDQAIRQLFTVADRILKAGRVDAQPDPHTANQ